MQLEHDRYTIIVGSGESIGFTTGGTFMFIGNDYPESPESILTVGGTRW